MTHKQYVLNMLFSDHYITKAEIESRSFEERQWLVNPGEIIKALRKDGYPIKTYMADNIHNTSRHAQYSLSKEYKLNK